VELRCPTCGHANNFDQPYAYHAGFSDQGFLTRRLRRRVVMKAPQLSVGSQVVTAFSARRVSGKHS